MHKNSLTPSLKEVKRFQKQEKSAITNGLNIYPVENKKGEL
jgi:hypothetical protein